MGEEHKMSGWKHRLKKTAPITIIFLFNFIIQTDAFATSFVTDPDKKTIVVDPGHGGKDIGARGPAGNLEKIIALNLARTIKDQLEDSYRVVLTRDGDYSPDIFSRTAIANHEKASVFLSLHTGASRLHSVRGYNIFHIEAPLRFAASKQQTSLNFKENNQRWDKIQNYYAVKSARLAREIDNHLFIKNNTNHTVRGAPLLILRGADMPAVLIEAGFITNPSEEKLLSDDEYVKDFCRKISAAIRNFLEKKETN